MDLQIIINTTREFFEKNIFGIIVNVVAIILGAIITYLALRKYKNNDKSLLLYLPGVWTAIGVLGTFVVLYIKLGFSDVDPNNIPALIKDLASAFSTSVIGISASLIISIWLKYNNIHQETGQPWSRKSTHELLWLQRKQLKKLNKKFEGVTKEMLDSLTTSLGKVVEGYTKEMKKSFEDLNKAAGKEISKINSTLKEEVTKLIQENLKVIEDSFKNIKDWQAVSKTAINTTYEKFKSAVEQYDDFKDSNKETLVQLEKQFDVLEGLNSNTIAVHNSIAAYDNRNSEIEGCLISIKNLLQRLDQLNGNTTK